jgi:hypothetical protein
MVRVAQSNLMATAMAWSGAAAKASGRRSALRQKMKIPRSSWMRAMVPCRPLHYSNISDESGKGAWWCAKSSRIVFYREFGVFVDHDFLHGRELHVYFVIFDCWPYRLLRVGGALVHIEMISIRFFSGSRGAFRACV